MSGKNKSVCFAVLSIVFVLAAGLVVSGCGGSAAVPKPGKVYKVMFEASGGEPIPEPQLVEAGGKIELPKTMARTKFTFSGWYKDFDCKEPWDFARDTVEGDIILFANWKSAAGKSGGGGGGGGGNPSGGGVPGGGTTRFTVTFDGNGGSPAIRSVNNVANGTSVGANVSPYPTNGAEPFFGWNTEANGTGTAFTSKTAVTGSITLYAQWGPPEHSSQRNGSHDPGKAFLVSTPDALRFIGKGNPLDPAEHKQWTLDKCYELNEDIDMDNEFFEPIGTMSDPFEGVFDGNGHVIENLTIDAGTTFGQGMFGVVGNYGCDPDLNKVTGLTLVNCDLDCRIFSTAGMVGINYGTVEYCNVIDGTIIGDINVGGVVGYNFGTVQNCYVTASVTAASWYTGGVVGGNAGTVQNCYATGSVYSTGYGVGGVVGYHSSALVRNCYAMCIVEGNNRVGGVVGLTSGSSTVQNCYATGSITAVTDQVGGVVGLTNGSSTVQDCVALNTSVTITTATAEIGRVVGSNSGTLTNNYARDGLNPSGGSWSKDAGDDKVDGADFMIDAPLSDVFDSSNGWSSSVWNNIPASGNLAVGVSLPTLKDMPAGTQNPKLLALTP